MAALFRTIPNMAFVLLFSVLCGGGSSFSSTADPNNATNMTEASATPMGLASVSFKRRGWVDNWHQFYLARRLVTNRPDFIAAGNLSNSETLTFSSIGLLALDFITKDLKHDDSGLEYI